MAGPPESHSPCTRNGSPTISLTGIFGFSEAYGSWNTICMSLRITRRSPAGIVVSSRPSNFTEPPVGFCSCKMARPVVVLPDPDSPTRPNVSPGATVKLTSVTAWTKPIVLRTRPRADREVLLEVLHFEDRCADEPVARGHGGHDLLAFLAVGAVAADDRLACDALVHHCAAHGSDPSTAASSPNSSDGSSTATRRSHSVHAAK